MAVKNTGIPPHPSAQPSGLPPDDMLLTYAEAGAYLRCTARQVRRLVEEGRLGRRRISERRIRIEGRHIREFVEAAEEQPADPLAAARPRKQVRSRS